MFKNPIIGSLIIVGLFGALFIIFESQPVKAVTDTVLVTQAVSGEISISDAANVTLDTTIPGMTGGTSNSPSATTWTVKTNDTSGYTLTLKKNQLLLTGAGGADKQFDDYTENVPLDYTWTAPGAGAEKFGFNVTAGTDVVQKYKNAAGPVAPCNTAGGIVSEGFCWNKIVTDPSTETISTRATTTPSAGIDTSIKFRAQAGGSNFMEEGSYTTTITATATINS